MTIAGALLSDSGCLFGVDSLVTAGSLKLRSTHSKWVSRGRMVAVSSGFTFNSIFLRDGIEAVGLTANNLSSKTVRRLSTYVQERFTAAGVQPESGQPNLPIEALITNGREMYELGGYLEPESIRGITFIGSGAVLAYGAYWSSVELQHDSETAFRSALIVAAKHDTTCGPPLTLWNVPPAGLRLPKPEILEW